MSVECATARVEPQMLLCVLKQQADGAKEVLGDVKIRLAARRCPWFDVISIDFELFGLNVSLAFVEPSK